MSEKNKHNEADILRVSIGGLDDEALDRILQNGSAMLQGAFYLWSTLIDTGLEEWSSERLPHTCSDGRVFTGQIQLHWRQEIHYIDGEYANAWRIVYAGPASLCPHAFDDGETEKLVPGCKQKELVIRLWGERRDEQQSWMEPRIPRDLDYPIPGKSRWVVAKVVRYLKNGQEIYSRWAEVLPWKESA